jgi:hypothetical protein
MVKYDEAGVLVEHAEVRLMDGQPGVSPIDPAERNPDDQ